jgi:hypothetical protein
MVRTEILLQKDKIIEGMAAIENIDPLQTDTIETTKGLHIMRITENPGTIGSILVNTTIESINTVTKTDTDSSTMTIIHGDSLNVSATVQESTEGIKTTTKT